MSRLGGKSPILCSNNNRKVRSSMGRARTAKAAATGRVRIAKAAATGRARIAKAAATGRVIFKFRGSTLIYILFPKLIYIWITDNFLGILKAREQS